MHLRSITLKGFKSFPDRSKLEFAPGISVVVGPNGSGKSNITDAVLWALGEQSPQAVRGQTMQDVIFAGGHGLKARKGAEVEVVIDNDDGRLATDFCEVSVSRRVDRSGQSEYRINGARCRLIDVIELLSDTGLGKEMHSVVSQGRVEEVIQSRPRDRRLLIEEAAGLGKHRKRRHRAQLKLERTTENLSRVLDVEREARTGLKPLKRQAEAADLHARLRRQTLELEGELAADRLRALRAELEVADKQASKARGERERAEEALSELAERRQAAERSLTERSKKQETVLAAFYATKSSVERVRLARTRTGEKIDALHASIEHAQALAQSAAFSRDGGDNEALLSRLEKQLDAGARRRGEAETAVGDARQNTRQAATRLEDAQRRRSRLRVDLDEVEERLRRGAGLGEQARALAEAGADLLADQIEVEPGHEAALSAALGDRLRAGFAGDLAAGLKLLQGIGGGGRVIVRERLGDPGEATPPVPGAEALMAKVRIGGGAKGEVERLLANAWVVDDLAALPKDFRGVAVTRSGLAFRGHSSEIVAPESVEPERMLADRNRRERLAGELTRAEREVAGCQRDVDAADAAVAEAERERDEAESALRTLNRSFDEAGGVERSHLLEERRRAAGRLAADEALLPRTESAALALDDLLQVLEARHRELQADLRKDHEAGDARAAELRELAQAESRLQADLHAANERATECEVRSAHAVDKDGEAAAELAQIAGELGLELGPAAEPLDDEERERIERSLVRLGRRRDELGPVNPLAAKQYEEAVAHADELKAQREDTERAMQELEQLIRETDRQIREAFEKTFAETARHFGDMVAHLFPGGRGQLSLVTPEKPRSVLGGISPNGDAAPGSDAQTEGAVEGSSGDEGAEEELFTEPEQPGVEVELTPAGKATRRLSLLSGGEKALAALAFLFAVFLARPCPFYILDEVEAALDDHNIDRFLELLRRYSSTAQFIVVTHQKRTMDVADVVYGVSMGGDGVSKVISRRLASAVAGDGQGIGEDRTDRPSESPATREAA